MNTETSNNFSLKQRFLKTLGRVCHSTPATRAVYYLAVLSLIVLLSLIICTGAYQGSSAPRYEFLRIATQILAFLSGQVTDLHLPPLLSSFPPLSLLDLSADLFWLHRLLFLGLLGGTIVIWLLVRTADNLSAQQARPLLAAGFTLWMVIIFLDGYCLLVSIITNTLLLPPTVGLVLATLMSLSLIAILLRLLHAPLTRRFENERSARTFLTALLVLSVAISALTCLEVRAFDSFHWSATDGYSLDFSAPTKLSPIVQAVHGFIIHLFLMLNDSLLLEAVVLIVAAVVCFRLRYLALAAVALLLDGFWTFTLFGKTTLYPDLLLLLFIFCIAYAIVVIVFVATVADLHRKYRRTRGALDISEARLIIIGGGGAGLSAALAAHRSGIPRKEILLVERHDYLGGILPQCLHAGFGVRRQETELDGPAYIAPLIDQFQRQRIPCLLRTSALRIDSDGLVTLAAPDGICQLSAEFIILATGCRERPIGSLPVAGTRPAGIMTAGAAQKMVNVNGWDIGQRIVVLGSGDIGLIMAGRFAALGKKVVAVIEQADRCGGLHRNRVRYLEAYGIPLLLRSTVTEIFGDSRLEKLQIVTRQPDGTRRRCWVECDTLITSVGLISELDLLQNSNASAQNAESKIRILAAGNAWQIRNFIEDVLDDGTAAGEEAARQL